VLQSADILIYRAHAVPVGKDQAAHLELSREIARRFNHLFETDLFPEPEPVISDDTGVLPGLDVDASGKLRKMSKSYGNAIYLTDTPDQIAAKMKTAFTSPLKIKKTDPASPKAAPFASCAASTTRPATRRSGTSAAPGARLRAVQARNDGILVEALAPVRERRARYESDPAELDRLLAHGAEQARDFAEDTLRRVREAMNLV
jgi:tryptophanyl-tRNA synthetase